MKNNKSCDLFVFLVHGDISLNMNSTNVILCFGCFKYLSWGWGGHLRKLGNGEMCVTLFKGDGMRNEGEILITGKANNHM